MAIKAYLHFGGAGTVDTFGPRLTIGVEARETETPRAGQTVTGYGAKLPTPYMVKHNGKWRRVYAACYGNAASHYIGKPGAWLATVSIERE
ncbi:hypothetical protein RCCWILLIS_94 [Rhodobacter phage RcCWillis]|nr:hypothetical protein RCCWILLIS_94 [Rhodobacter phage RcCWillis]